MKKILALVLAAIFAIAIIGCTSQPEAPAPTEAPASAPEATAADEVVVMSHADYVAAELSSKVTVETYVQAHQSWWDNKITVYGQSEDGAYFMYEMACSEEDAAKLEPGTAIRVTGYKSEWAGEIEITDATFEIIDGSYTATPVDVTALIGTDDLIAHQNEAVCFAGMTIESVAFKNDQPGDDIYVTASKDGVSVDFCLEYYLNGKDADFYAAVSELKAGDVCDIAGFLYWYNGANPHITAINVTESAPAAAAVKVLGLNLKNKTGAEIAEAYFYVTGAEDKGAPVVCAWPDKDVDEANYEKFVYIVRDVAESYTMEVVYADGTNASLDLGAVECYDKISLKGAAPEDWKHEPNDDEADKAAIDEVIAAGKTSDGCYPGYKAVGLEVKNKTGNDITEFYIVPAGADKAAAKNIVAEVVNYDGAKLDGAWTSGKGGFYIYSFILVPEDTTAVDVYLVYADGSTCEALGYSDLFAIDGDGNLPNELSMKDAADPDLWKAAFDDGEEVKPNIDAAIAAGIPMNGTYPVY